MPVYLLSDGAGLPRQVPAHLTRIPISLISSSVDCSNRTVQVWRPPSPRGAGPLCRRGSLRLRKVTS